MESLKNKKLKRMEFGFNCVSKAIEDPDKIDQDFKSHIKNIPMYISSNGLIPTLAFIQSKANKAKSYKFIEQIMVNYFSEFNLIEKSRNNLQSVIEGLLTMNMTEYRKCTLEVLSVLKWIVKFAQGMIEDEEVQNIQSSEGENHEEV